MNNEQIDNTDYYRLPCGRYLEDFLEVMRASFAFGSAAKYFWRAGKKDGESKVKDLNKYEHYCQFMARVRNKSALDIRSSVIAFCDLARKWDGKIGASNGNMGNAEN